MKIKISPMTSEPKDAREIELLIVDIAPFIDLLKKYYQIDDDGNVYEFCDVNYDIENNYFEIALELTD